MPAIPTTTAIIQAPYQPHPQASPVGTAVVAGSMKNLCNVVTNVGNNLDAARPPPPRDTAFGSVRAIATDSTLPPKHFNQADKHVARIDSIIDELAKGVVAAAEKDFHGMNTGLRIASLGEKLTSLRNKWAAGELAGSSRWLKFGSPVANWRRKEGEAIVKKAMSLVEKNCKHDAYGNKGKSGAAFDLYMSLGSLHKMKL
jgi:hypothetical protein